MEKQFVTLVRHAKSSWKTPNQADYERPLNERGLRDGPTMAKRLVARRCIPELLLCSAATRAKQTAALLQAEFQLRPEQFEIHEDLYLASPQTLLEAISRIPTRVQHVMVVAHNPGLEDLCDILAGYALPPMPTLGIRQFACRSIIELKHWQNHANPKTSDTHKARESADTHDATAITPAKLLFDDHPKRTDD